jgi:NADPH:quinone reductase-like Zn-dependent oxidoreductase
MKAVRQTGYGSPQKVLEIAEVEKPSPDSKQVLIKVCASSVNAQEYRTVLADPLLIRFAGGFRRPKDPRLGSDLAGIIEAVGAEVTQFQPGDEVFGCAAGAYAEYVLGREKYLTRKPSNCTFEEAAVVPVAALTALQGLRDAGGIQAGQKVLIQGASGGVGTFAVQIAKHFGADVTAVVSPRNLELARANGADRVIDYKREDFTRGAERYDLILAANGYHPIWAYPKVLNPGGAYIVAGGTMPAFFQAILFGKSLSRRTGKKLGHMGIAKVNQNDLALLAELLESEAIRPVIDRSYPLQEIHAAMQYVLDTHPQGKVAISI